MKILSAIQTRELDAYTIKHNPISSIDLMEWASLAFVKSFIQKIDPSKKIKIFCGPGNNGGDGLVIARILINKSYKPVEVFTFTSEKYSDDYTANQNRLAAVSKLKEIKEAKDIPFISPNDVVIDAIFGSGLSKPVSGIYAEAINSINASTAKVFSVDIASGLFCDQLNPDSCIVEPDYTISFQLPKLSFLLPQNEKYVGEWEIADIGLNKQFIEEAKTDYFYTTKEDIQKILKPRSKFSHKGNFGKALIISGSYGMMGAAVLSSRACLRTGAGLCVSYIPQCGYEILQTAIPENMVLTDKERDCISDIPDLTSYDAIGVGPGIGKDSKTVHAIKTLLEKANTPLVIDADALNIISENKDLLNKIPKGSILTPHPKEFERLAGKSPDDYARLELLHNFSKQVQSYVILKGANTAICTPEGTIHFNSTGNPGMATGGSGDVLTGILTSLLAQGYSSFDAAILGVYLHGYAGDTAAKKISEPFMIASDIVEGISDFFREHKI